MTPEAYVNFILNTNADFLGYTSDSDFSQNLPTFAFGIAEEVFEVAVASTDDSRAKEVGDVVAYFCLLAAALGYDRERIESHLHSTRRSSNTANVVADYLGVAKRFFRGDATASQLLAIAYQLVLFSLSFSGLQLEPVLELNYKKLTARLSSTGTFHGKGDR